MTFSVDPLSNFILWLLHWIAGIGALTMVAAGFKFLEPQLGAWLESILTEKVIWPAGLIVFVGGITILVCLS